MSHCAKLYSSKPISWRKILNEVIASSVKGVKRSPIKIVSHCTLAFSYCAVRPHALGTRT